MEQSAISKPAAKSAAEEKKSIASVGNTSGSGKGLIKSAADEKSNSFMNKPFDEALEFSQSNSDESVDTRGSNADKHRKKNVAETKQPMPSASNPSTSMNNQQRLQPQVFKFYIIVISIITY